ncbi:hypothetical protein SynRS9902_02950 [Synechococcus sp. RS9902]|nr:hypothetical protein SynRS9902_02950 [Synechococcus sp. RS9902]
MNRASVWKKLVWTTTKRFELCSGINSFYGIKALHGLLLECFSRDPSMGHSQQHSEGEGEAHRPRFVSI